MNGHFWIEITTPQIRAGDYMLSGYGFQGGSGAIFSCFFDDEYLGVYDPTKGSWGGSPVDIGEVSFEVTKSHKLRLETTVPGQMFWDFIRFTPIE